MSGTQISASGQSTTPGNWITQSVNGMTYNVLLPANYDPAVKYPTLLYLHQLDMGNDPNDLLAEVDPWFNTTAFRTSTPAIIVMPLLDQSADPSGQTINFGGVSTDDNAGETNAIAALKQVMAQYSSDASRIYVTGNSMGGIGTEDMLIKFNAYTGTEGQIFAAGLALAGTDYGQGYPQPNASVVDGLKNVPFWAIHGGQDTQVPLAWDQNLYAAEQAGGGMMKYTQDDSLGHDVWDSYYPQSGAASPLGWLFSQKSSDQSAAPTPVPAPVPSATVVPVAIEAPPVAAVSPTAAAPSANNTVVTDTTAAITDASNNEWTITSGGQVAVNGIADATTANVIELAYVDGTIWHENTSNLWWGETQPNASWSPVFGASVSPLPTTPTPTPTPPGTLGSGSDMIVLQMSEDADGPVGAAGRDAEFTFNVDGQQIGGLLSVTASHADNQTQTFAFQGNFAPGTHKATVTFANNSMTGGDKAAFNDGGDRNVYVNSVVYDGATVSSAVTGIYESPFFAPMTTDGPHYGNAVFNLTDTTAIPANAPSTPTTSPAPVSVGSGPDTLTLAMSEDRYQTDAQFSVTVDGKLVANTLTASAIEYEGQTQQFQLHGNWATAPHTVSIAFLNDGTGPADARGTYDSVDRNLFINAVSYNSTVVSNTPWGIFEAGSKSYAVPATAAPQQPTPTPVPTPTPPTAPSVDNAVLMAGAGGAIVDASGASWTIANGAVLRNGTAAGYSANVTELAYVGGVVWQENAAKGWWGWDGKGWGLGNGTTTSPLPAAMPTTIGVRVSEDAYQGDAQFTVSVDGKQVGGTYSASALHASGDSSIVSLITNLTAGVHQVGIQFLNDAYGGTATTDRNLYVSGIALNGVTQTGSSASMLSNGTSTFNIGGSTGTVAAPADTLTLHLAQDAYNGNAQFTLTIDGKAVSTAQDVVSLHSAGAWDTVSFAGSFGAGSHTIGVNFTNDLYGGTASTDRNMYVNGIDVNGMHVGSGVTTLLSNGTASFTVTTAH